MLKPVIYDDDDDKIFAVLNNIQLWLTGIKDAGKI